ncbi:angiotensin-converting enzyme 2-like [Clupea harengus]|uniref:Angiotensin-converting enzyme 2-like n=1 Tax=Clupea harengus TaxID=7950 RepID=A0A6P8FSN2_CLUHA|nr:angiotensin-converting enzyme 2-like [Clupea harengus]
MWLKPLLVVALAGIYAQAKEEGNGQNYGKVEEETRWSSKVVDSPDAFKVRLSLKAAMGDEAYAWNENELYLFKATTAYSMRQYYVAEKGQQVNFTSGNVVTSKETQRISFIFYVTDPRAPATIIPKAEVEAAVRLSRGRINSAFLLSDDTLEFVGLLATLPPPSEPGVQVWLIVFGVVMSLVAGMGVFLIVSGFRDRKRKSKLDDDEEKPVEETENEGETNLGLEEDDDGRTKL